MKKTMKKLVTTLFATVALVLLGSVVAFADDANERAYDTYYNTYNYAVSYADANYIAGYIDISPFDTMNNSIVDGGGTVWIPCCFGNCRSLLCGLTPWFIPCLCPLFR